MKIVSVVDNASELQREVAIANMPDNLREEMRDRLPKTAEINENPSANQLLTCIRTASEEDTLTLERLAGVLRGKGISIKAEDVAEEAVAQGLLIRCDNGSFLLLG